MIIDCISDLHGCKPALQGGDLLIVAGDLTARDTPFEYFKFFNWIANTPYKKIIVIAGNHDGLAQSEDLLSIGKNDFEYLQDSGTEYEGLKIWGSPWTPEFCNWHFMKEKGEPMKAVWDLIPLDTDILITHGPPFGVLDKNTRNRCGCVQLIDRIPLLNNLKLHVFGHIHEGYGQENIRGTTFVNASIMNGNYKPVNKPIRIIL